MPRLSACFVALLLAPLPLRAEWLERVEDGIMGTRIAVELWADDAAQGRAAIEAVLTEMRHVDEAIRASRAAIRDILISSQGIERSRHIFKSGPQGGHAGKAD